MCILCPDTPPEKATSKQKGGMQNTMIGYQNNPNKFQVDLKDACCKDPLCCCVGFVCAPAGCSACWSRKTVLETKLNGIDDFLCCQGYIGGCACIKPAECCAGSPVGLCLEGCCCPVLSISIARIHIMDLQQLQPDPMDYQIIQCSNFLQLLACVCQIAALVCNELQDLANLIDCIANAFTLSVSGCMIAQINKEIQHINASGKGGGGGTFVATAVPVVQGQPMRGAPPAAESMER